MSCRWVKTSSCCLHVCYSLPDGVFPESFHLIPPSLYRIQILCRRHPLLSYPAGLTIAEVSLSLFTPLSPSLFTSHEILCRASLIQKPKMSKRRVYALEDTHTDTHTNAHARTHECTHACTHARTHSYIDIDLFFRIYIGGIISFADYICSIQCIFLSKYETLVNCFFKHINIRACTCTVSR